jgi:sugar lactone lactonase YvrE
MLLNGATFAPGRFGQAFSFDGVDDVVQLPNSASLNFHETTPMTVEMWLYRSTAGTMHLFGKRVECGFGFQYQLAIGTDALIFGGQGYDGGFGVAEPVQLPLNVWTHVAGTFDGSTLNLYVNGQSVWTGPGSLGPINTAPVLIGGAGTCSHFAGLIDEVKIFNRALSPSEIQAEAEMGGTATPTPTPTPSPTATPNRPTCGTSPAQNATYDLKADWSDTSNPNGVWSYNEGSTPLPLQNPWNPSDAIPGPGWAHAQWPNFGHVPVWIKNPNVSHENFVTGDIVVHSSDSGRGENYGPANVTWTSPVAAVMTISGSAWISRTTDRSNQWTLYLNGNALSTGQMLSGGPYNRDNQFAFSAGSGGASALTNIPVSPGDVVKLEVTKLSTYGDFVGVNLRIALSCNLSPGNILVADGSSQTIWAIDPLSGAKTPISVAGLLGFPRGIALDSGGQIVVGDSTTNLVVRINPLTGVQTVLSSGGFDDVAGIAVEADGHILASDINFTRVYRIDAVTGAKTVLVNGGVGWNPFGIALESDGNILATVISGGTGNKIDRINSVTGARSTVSSGGLFRDLRGLTVERTGNFLVVDGGARTVFRVDPVTGDQTVVSSGGLFQFPSGVAVEASGSILVADPTAKAVFRVNPVTGAQSIVSSGGGFGYPEGILVVGGNQSPVADAGPDQTVECTSASGIDITLNGSASFDPEGDPLTLTWNVPFGTQTGPEIVVTLAPGIHTITLTVDDGKGGTASDTVTVAVSADTTPPIPDIATLPTVTGQCSVTLTPPMATDNCAGTIIGTTTDPLTYASQGIYTVHWSYNDGHGNIVTQVQTVIVQDTTSPVITARATNKLLSADANCQATVPNLTSEIVATDNCSPVTITQSPAAGTVVGIGDTQVTLRIKDDVGNESVSTATVTVVDTTPPSITCPANIVAVGNIPNSCSAALNPGVATAIDSCSIASVVGVRSDGHALNDSYPLGNTTITWTATDTTGNPFSCQQSVTVTNPNPLVSITGPPSGAVYAVRTPVSFTGSFTDNPGGTHTGIWMSDIITQAATLVEPVGSTPGSANTTYTFTSPGVYLVTLTVSDGCGGTSTADTVEGLTAMVVIYDPDGGFVTGGGWISSPAGAYVLDSSLSGKANFGFVSKYQHGATVPTGQTEFQFKVANLNFSSTVYEWLVVAGARAQYKGSGTINGSGNYGFLLTVVDGQLEGGGGADKFRIKIWDKNNGSAIVYDNQINDSDSGALTTGLGAGSIIIHQ